MRRGGRVLRAALLAGVASTFAVGAGASFDGTTPAVTGSPALSPWIVNPGDTLTIHGSHFGNDTTGDCTTLTSPPTIIFAAVASPDDKSQWKTTGPVGSDTANCTSSMVKVKVPTGLPGGASVSVRDAGGRRSNANFEITLAPTTLGPISPSVGDLSTGAATYTGAGLQPPTAAGLTFTVGGGAVTPLAWTDSGIRFSVPNSTVSVGGSIQVSTDASNPNTNVQNIGLNPATYVFQAPSLGAASPSSGTVGTRVTISGAHLGPAGTVSFGGVPAQGVSWSANQVVATISPGTPDTAAIAATASGFALTGPSLTILPVVTGVSPRSAYGGQVVSVTGNNLGSSGTVTVGGLTQAATWSPTHVTFTLSPDADSGEMSLVRGSDSAVATGTPSLTITPHLTQLESNNLAPGTPVVADGVSLGSQAGTARVGSEQVTPQLWSRTSVLLAVPLDLAPGTYPVSVSNPAGAVSNLLDVTVVAAPALPSPRPGQSAAPSAPSNPLVPHYDNNHQFVKPIKLPSPVNLTLDAEPKSVAAGGEATITVTLKLLGKPVDGAPVKLTMITSPSKDFAFVPDSGVTDATGTFQAKVKVSSSPGDNIILAQSGAFSDQDRVVGTGTSGDAGVGSTDNPAGSSLNPAATGPILPLLGLGIVAATLVAGGLFVNFRSHGPLG